MVRRIRRIVAVLAVAAVWPLAAQGQVAAPGLLPYANPATLAWEFSPIFLSSLIVAEQSARRNASREPAREGDGSGLLLRGRIPHGSVAWGFQYLDAGLDLGNANTGTTKQGLRTYSLALAMRFEKVIALGIGIEGNEETEETATSDVKLGTTTPMIGISLRLADVIYLASVHGRRRLNTNVTDHDGQKRNMSRLAAGLRWFNSFMLVHAEYSREESPPFRKVTFPALPGFSFDVMDTEVETFVTEIIIQGVLIGYTQANTTTLGSPLRNETILTQFFTLGFTPPKGPVLTLTNRIEETEDRIKGTDEKLDVWALGIGWRF